MVTNDTQLETADSAEAFEQAVPAGGLARLRRFTGPLLLLAIVAFGLAIRLYNLDSFPDTLLADETDNAQAAIRILHGQPPPNGFFGFDWTAQPAYSVYLLSWSIALFGSTITAIRLPSAILGALALIPFYFLLRRQFSTATALLTTFLLATEVWYLNFSRSGWNNGHICLYMLMAMLFFVLALDRVKEPRGSRLQPWLYFGLTGLFCALGLYSYPSGRIIALGLVLFLPVAAWFYRRQWKKLLLGYALVGVVAAVLFAPQALYIVRNWELFNGRTGTVALTNSPQYRADPASALWTQVQRNVRGPWDGGVNNTAQYTPVGEPQLAPVTGWLVLAGMLLSVLLPGMRRRPETWLWWIMLLTAWAATQLLTVGTPNGARGIVYLPALVYFAAVTLQAVLDLAALLLKRLTPAVAKDDGRRTTVTHYASRITHYAPLAVTAALVLLVGFASVEHYWSWQSKPRTRQDRWEYVTTSEFPAWVAWITDAANSNRGVTNLGQWHTLHPVPDPSLPAPAGSPPRPPEATPTTR
jgi:4-amino-4-deoxy-L-arabinose transferase-like glycosyltransferase